MRLDTWGELDDLAYDRNSSLTWPPLRFTQAGRGVLVLGPVGSARPTSPPHWDTSQSAAGSACTPTGRQAVHAAPRRRAGPHVGRRTPQTDPRRPADPRRLALKPLDATQTNDFYELIVERHERVSTIVTSNREPAEWLTMMSDARLAQSAVDRLSSGAHTLIIEGPSYRQRPLRRANLDHQAGQH